MFPRELAAAGADERMQAREAARKAKKRHAKPAAGGEAQLRAQLAALGLRVEQVDADGNCFFVRAAESRWLCRLLRD